MLNSWAVYVGFVCACLALLSGVGAVFRALWKFARALVRFADAMPKLLALAEREDGLNELRRSFEDFVSGTFAEHAADDATFQEWIMGRLDRTTEGS